MKPCRYIQNCINCLDKAIAKYGKPLIFNSDQGSQFTCKEWVNKLEQHNIIISMDGKGRWADNVYVERFWRTLKYECIFLRGIETVIDLKHEVADYIEYYNNRRLHSRLGYTTPHSVYNNNVTNSVFTESAIYCTYPPFEERTKCYKKRILPSVIQPL